MKKIIFAILLLATMAACTDPMEDTLESNGVDGDPITIKQ